MIQEFFIGLVVLVLLNGLLLGTAYLYEKYEEIVKNVFLVLLVSLSFIIICCFVGKMTLELWKNVT